MILTVLKEMHSLHVQILRTSSRLCYCSGHDKGAILPVFSHVMHPVMDVIGLPQRHFKCVSFSVI